MLTLHNLTQNKKQELTHSTLKADIDPVKAQLQFGFDVSEEDLIGYMI